MKHTRIALPEVEYLQRIGEIAYTASYIEWTLLGDIPRLKDRLPDSFCLDTLEPKTTGGIAKQAEAAASQCRDNAVRSYLEVMGRALSAIAGIRNDVLHARPATDDTKGRNQQRLYRVKVDPKLKLTKDRFWINDDWLDTQVDTINEILDQINAVRPPFED